MKDVIFMQLHNRHSPKYDRLVAFSFDMKGQQIYHYTILQVYRFIIII